jgi:hypothetical protein
MRSVIQFFNAKNICSAEIHHKLVEVYGEGVMNERMCVSGVICLMGERQMCTVKRNLDACLSSPRIHDNTRPHTAEKTKKLLEKFGWENLDHSPYSPDLAPSDFHLFPTMKVFGRHTGGN